jgi:hypothetical protein
MSKELRTQWRVFLDDPVIVCATDPEHARRLAHATPSVEVEPVVIHKYRVIEVNRETQVYSIIYSTDEYLQAVFMLEYLLKLQQAPYHFFIGSIGRNTL